jgi:hypothetical protein
MTMFAARVQGLEMPRSNSYAGQARPVPKVFPHVSICGFGDQIEL